MNSDIYSIRPFVYRDRGDMNLFLLESPLWKDIYEVYLRVKHNACNLNIPAVNVFNEVRYLCVRVMIDKYSAKSRLQDYLDDAYTMLRHRYATDLCCSMVYAVLSLRKDSPDYVKEFCEVLRDEKLKHESNFFPSFDGFVKRNRMQGVSHNLNLTAEGENPKIFLEQSVLGKSCKLRVDYDWWKKVTYDFDQQRIRTIVSMWTRRKEMLMIVDTIEDSFNHCEKVEKRKSQEMMEVSPC